MTKHTTGAGGRQDPAQAHAPVESGPLVVAEFAKNSRERVRVSLTLFKGVEYADIRVFWESESGTWLPSKKGITLSVELVRDLLLGVDSLQRNLEERGLVEAA